MKKNVFAVLVLLILSFFSFQLKSQDLIIRTKGDTLKAKVLEVGTSTVSYKKASMPDGPTFVVEKKEIIFIKYANGEVQDFFDENAASQPVNKNNQPVKDNSGNQTTPKDSTAKTQPYEPEQGPKNKIEMINNKYTINGQKASLKDVNRYLEKSKNPAIQMSLKSTKATGTFQKIMKITSYPTTIAGGITSIYTVAELYQLKQRGRASRGDFVKAGWSLFGTAVFPISSKILKHFSDKKYDKIIDIYNETN